MVGGRSGRSAGRSRRFLADAGGELSVKAIHAEVERMLEGGVSRYSVSDLLLRRSKGPRPLFVLTRHGHYQTFRVSG
jgi:hypothetical protein